MPMHFHLVNRIRSFSFFPFLISKSSLHIKDIILLSVVCVTSYTFLFVSDEDGDSEQPNTHTHTHTAFGERIESEARFSLPPQSSPSTKNALL